jgi:hypothetical protein
MMATSAHLAIIVARRGPYNRKVLDRRRKPFGVG